MRLVRRLMVGEADLYRALRLEALRESPEAFGSKHADAMARSPESWIEQADGSAIGSDRATFIIWDEVPVGLVALYRSESDPRVGELIQMWVAPDKRGGVVAVELLCELLLWASLNGFLSVRAEVLEGNSRALSFYEKQGFKRCDEQLEATEAGILLIKELSNPHEIEP